MAPMTSRQRMLTALQGGVPDRLPVTTHHVMPYILKHTMNGMTTQQFFDHFGFDQDTFFVGCTPQQTRAEVRRCFEEAGPNGGYILSPSDHFFDADPELLHAFVDEAHQCSYELIAN